jgi:hypothetical protein
VVMVGRRRKRQVVAWCRARAASCTSMQLFAFLKSAVPSSLPSLSPALAFRSFFNLYQYLCGFLVFVSHRLATSTSTTVSIPVPGKRVIFYKHIILILYWYQYSTSTLQYILYIHTIIREELLEPGVLLYLVPGTVTSTST